MDLPVEHVRTQVTSAIDVIVHLGRLRDGRRIVLQVTSVEGLADGEPELCDLFSFDPRRGPSGSFVATGAVPGLARTLVDRGERVDGWMFSAGEDA
ncbi:MAG: hypothetical protein WEA10_04955 [Actinomycetota bacterium]